MTPDEKLKVLVIDDSALVRKVLRMWIGEQADMEVMAVASDPIIAVEKMKQQRPDVITLDIEMPRMDGLTFLRKLMTQHPIPVVVVSSLSRQGGEVAMKALEYGAVDIFLKDDIMLVTNDDTRRNMLMSKIRAAGQSRARSINRANTPVALPGQELVRVSASNKVIVLGASTGGTNAILEVLQQMPGNSEGIVIVQHMPKAFTKLFADRLNELSALTVKEAEEGDRVVPGRVLIAPGDRHVLLHRSGNQVTVRLSDAPHVNLHKPSVDVLFFSAAEQLGKNAIGVLLTGMGSDGAKGLLAVKNAGGFTIAQDEQTSVVYGMPKEAVKLNAAAKVLPLGSIAGELTIIR